MLFDVGELAAAPSQDCLIPPDQVDDESATEFRVVDAPSALREDLASHRDVRANQGLNREKTRIMVQWPSAAVKLASESGDFRSGILSIVKNLRQVAQNFRDQDRRDVV